MTPEVIDKYKIPKSLEIQLLKTQGKRGIGVKINKIYVGTLYSYGTLPQQSQIYRLYIKVHTGNRRYQAIPMFFTKKNDFNKVEEMFEKYKPKKTKKKPKKTKKKPKKQKKNDLK